MYCPHCAAELRPNQSVCQACGQGITPIVRPPAAAVQSWPQQGPAWTAPPPQPASMPQSVRLAGLLLLGALAFSLLSLLALVARAASSVGVSTLFTVVLQTLVYDVAWGILVFFLWKRQNWARFVIVVFVVYTIAMSVFGFSRGLASIGFGNMSYLFSLATTFAVAAVRAYAAYLLYQPEANAYFKNR